MRISKFESLLIVLLVALTVFLFFQFQQPPAPISADAPAKEFSAERAMDFLKIISNKPHAGGTPEHKKVREYIINYCEDMGLEVSLEEKTGIRRFSGYMISGYAQNIHARLHGSSSEKTILVMSHYDSQPNTPAAADDGSGVAAMMESIRALTSSEDRLEHDVLFLFTDLEEFGLLGAEAFVHNADLKDVAVVLNFEARGNSGAPIVFEVSPENGWLIREFSKGAPYPVANSMGYEVYKRMPNDTDLSMFKETDLTLLNSAFIDGYVNYHSMTDSPENIDQGSLQHQGANMLGLIRHFGTQDLTITKDKDYIFFNPLGSWLIIYPLSFDLVLIMFSVLLFLSVLVFGIRRKSIQLPHFLIGTGMMLLTIIISIVLSIGLQWLILKLYPHYDSFYSSNFYNSSYYLIAFTGMVMIGCYFSFHWASKKYNPASLMAGALLVHFILIFVLKIYLSTGAFMLHFPFNIAVLIFLVWILRSGDSQTLIRWVNFSMMLPALFIWTGFAYLLYIVFSLEMPFGAVAILSLFSPFLIPLLILLDRIVKKLFLYCSLALLVIGLLLGHFTSSPTRNQPQQTNLMYALDLDTNEAQWITALKQPDPWNVNYVEEKREDNFRLGYSVRDRWMKNAEIVDMGTGSMQVEKDTVVEGKRLVKLRMIPGESTVSFDMEFPAGIMVKNLNEREVNLSSGNNPNPFIRFNGVPESGIVLDLVTDQGSEIKLKLIERKIGLPTQLFSVPLPANYIPGPGYFSNSSHVKRSLTF